MAHAWLLLPHDSCMLLLPHDSLMLLLPHDCMLLLSRPTSWLTWAAVL